MTITDIISLPKCFGELSKAKKNFLEEQF